MTNEINEGSMLDATSNLDVVDDRRDGPQGRGTTEVADLAVSERSSRASIIEVATRLFGEVGYPGTTIRDIASEVGIFPGSLYAHIDGKEGLLMTIVASGIDRFHEAVNDVDPKLSPRDRLRAMMRVHVGVVAENPPWALVVFHQWRYLKEPNLAIVREKRRAYERLFSEVVTAGVESGDFVGDIDQRIAVLSLLGSLNWTAEWLSRQQAQVDVIGEQIAEVILRGLARP